MKKFLFLIIVSVLVISGCSAKNNSNAIAANSSIEETASNGDLPLYNIEQMLKGKTDLVVLVNVDSVSEVKDKKLGNPEGSHQEAALHIEETFFGKAASDNIKLYQSRDKVKANQKYLLFLSYRPEIDQYVVSDGASQSRVDNTNSLAEAANKVLTVKIEGIQGLYSNEELKQLLNEKSSKL
ncbi:hypothetical protein [Cohnella laeviribosi]|uniref:hypothetical protein n=1 Tax=Cohnella laeviribosi TaxID=380174 RepID=UPI003D1CFB9E